MLTIKLESSKNRVLALIVNQKQIAFSERKA